MKHLNLLLFFSFICIICCSSGYTNKSITEINSGTGKYTFMITDSSGTKLAEGILTISENIEYKIRGNYIFEKLYKEFQGFASMKGKFEGYIYPETKTLFIDTNPGTADDNVFFDLKIKADNISGIWYYSAFRQQNIKGNIFLLKNKNN